MEVLGSQPFRFCRPVYRHVRRGTVEQDIVDMTACDTETDHDGDNSAPADALPPRVWNEASVTDAPELDGESDTDSLPGSVIPLEGSG